MDIVDKSYSDINSICDLNLTNTEYFTTAELGINFH